MTDPTGNGWSEYRKFVVANLEINQERLSSIEKRLRVIENDIVSLKTKIYFGAGIISFAISVAASIIVSVAK